MYSKLGYKLSVFLVFNHSDKNTTICNHLACRTFFLIVGTWNQDVYVRTFRHFSANGINDYPLSSLVLGMLSANEIL